jgi:hypothetical protein
VETYAQNLDNMSHKIEGLALISSTLENLKWWKNNKIPQEIHNDSYKLLIKIIDNFKIGLKNVYRFKRLALMKDIDQNLNELMSLDPEAQAIDFRIIYNPTLDGKVNEGRITKANPFNLSMYGN